MPATDRPPGAGTDPGASVSQPATATAALLAAARQQHPELCVDEQAFARFVQPLLAGADSGSGASSLVPYAGDLYLACGCALGTPAAVARFEALCLPAARSAVARVTTQPQHVEDVMQDLRARLLCAGESGSPPRITRYAGRGPLIAWVRTAAVRLSLDRLREHRREVALPEDEEALPPAASGAGSEHGLIRQHYREHFQQAFAAALRTLSARERTLLRLHLLDGLTEEQIGTMYSAHRVTIARWLRRTRDQILRETQRLLAERLGLPPGELESVTGLVPSRLDHSLSSLLRSR